jgi:hypothetical protein
VAPAPSATLCVPLNRIRIERRISASETATIRAAPRRLMSSASESTQAVHFVAQPPNPHQFSRWIEPWAWEKPNTLARYYVCTEGVAVSQI